MTKFLVKKSLNNNVILAEDTRTKEEVVLVGKGIGFKANKGKMVDKAKIEKIFCFFDKALFAQYKNTINRIDKSVIGVTEEIIAMVSGQLKEQLNEHIHTALADHINFTLERLSSNLEIKNPFLNEIKILYREEYNLACKAAKIIDEKLNVEIPDGEKGFIAMHIHAARINHGVSNTVKFTSMVNEMIKIIKSELKIKINKNNSSYSRLLIHLRFALERIVTDIPIENPLTEKIKEELPESYQIAEKLGDFIETRLNKRPPEDELGYLTLHIERIKRSSR